MIFKINRFGYSWGDLSFNGESPHLWPKHHYPWQAIYHIVLKAHCMSRLHNLFHQIGGMKIDTSVDGGEPSFLHAKPWIPGGEKSIFTVDIH